MIRDGDAAHRHAQGCGFKPQHYQKKKTKASPRLIITEVVCFTVLNQVFLELLIQVEYALLY